MTQKRQPSFAYLLLIIGIISLLFYGMTGDKTAGSSEYISINQLADEIKDGNVIKMNVQEDTVTAQLKSKEIVKALKESNSTLLEQLEILGVTADDLSAKNVTLTVKEPSAWGTVVSLIISFLPLVLFAVMMVFLYRQQGGGSGAMSFGKSRAKMIRGENPTVTFADVAGIEEAKEELQEVVEFLKNPAKFTALGARIPKGILLVGSPGTGKTLLAKAVSGEAGVPFFFISGSDFVEMFVGVGASRVRDLFEQARKNSPCIIFIDEIDAVGRQRGAGLGGSHDEREQTLNQMLVEMDGFGTDSSVIVMAATNRPDILDPALLRPGRFDRRVVIDRPDVRGREQILRIHAKGKPMEDDVDYQKLARGTVGMVGADLENLVNEAAIVAARRGKKTIGNAELEEAFEKVLMGPEKRSNHITDSEKSIIAYHEAGHAVVMNVLPECDPVHRITIIGRGSAGGYTMNLPAEDRVLNSKKQLLAQIVSLMGGRAAEELKFDDITSGASNDIERASQLARTMVTQLGMSKLGPLAYGKKDEMVFLGREISEQRNYSETVAEKIDAEVDSIVLEAYNKAKSILTEYNEQLTAVANALIERETLTDVEFQEIFPAPNGKKSATPQLNA